MSGKAACGLRHPNKSCSRAVVQSCSQILYFIKTCRTAELCRHVIRDEHPRSAMAERDRTAQLCRRTAKPAKPYYQGFSGVLNPILGRFFCSDSCCLANSSCLRYSKISIIFSSCSVSFFSRRSSFSSITL